MPRYDFICQNGHELIDFIKSVHDPKPACPECGEPTETLWTQSQAVIGDDIPGGVVIRHLDPEPRRYYSKTEIRRRANERGWIQDGDTPKPYKVHWSGRRQRNYGEREDL